MVARSAKLVANPIRNDCVTRSIWYFRRNRRLSGTGAAQFTHKCRSAVRSSGVSVRNEPWLLVGETRRNLGNRIGGRFRLRQHQDFQSRASLRRSKDTLRRRLVVGFFRLENVAEFLRVAVDERKP